MLASAIPTKFPIPWAKKLRRRAHTACCAMFVLGLCSLVIEPAIAQAVIGSGVWGDVKVSGVSPATWTLEQNIGAAGAQGTSPFVVSGTFNTASADVPVVGIVQAKDFAGGVITGVSVAGPGA
jgi:hypothetical protein